MKFEMNVNSMLFNTSKTNSLYILGGVFFLALILRLYYYNTTVLLELDAMDFFSYAVDIHVLGTLPENYAVAKQGWPVFLAALFSIFNFDYTEAYMQLQKISAIFLSSITIFPVYLLCRKFLERKYSFLSAAIFASEPHLVYNSITGNSESLYILCIIVTIVCFMSQNKKIVYFSFILAGISSIVRPEGLFVFISISIMFLVRFRKEYLNIPKYILAATLFMLILSPIMINQEKIEDGESLFVRVYNSIGLYFPSNENPSSVDSLEQDQKIQQINPRISIITGIENFPKFLGWVLIPTFILLAPLGFILFFRNMENKKLTIIVLTTITAIPAFYAYSYPLPEIKYLFFLFPFFCIFSGFSLKLFLEKIHAKNFLLIIIVVAIVSSSVIFMDYKYDFRHQDESSMIAKYIVDNTRVINGYYPEAKYIEAMDLPKDWSELKNFYANVDRDKTSTRSKLPHKILIIDPNEYDSMEELIFSSKDKKLTHLILDGKEKNPDFLNQVYFNEEALPYLEKVYDSSELGYNYHVKIFKINLDN